MAENRVSDAINRLNFALSKVNDFDVSDIELSERVLDNRIITIEGYLRYLEREGIPKLKKIYERFGGDSVE